jgi:hypothetical protein
MRSFLYAHTVGTVSTITLRVQRFFQFVMKLQQGEER